MLLGVFLFSLGIGAAIASTTPTQTPATSYSELIPNFRAMLVGSGTDPSNEGDLNVTGNMTVVGDLVTDSLDTYSASELNFTDYFTAKHFGDAYFVNSSGYSTVISGVYSSTAACTYGDYLVGCTGYVTSPSSTNRYFGSIATKSGTLFTKRFTCTSYASTTAITSQAACFSSSDEQGTNSSSI